MNWWTNMSFAAKWVTSIAAGIIALGGSFATIGGGIEQVDKLVTTEIEHGEDVKLLLKQISSQNTRIEQALDREDQREINDRIQRNNREIRRIRAKYRNERDPVERDNLQADIDTYLEENECINAGTC